MRRCQLVSDCADELGYAKIHVVTVGLRLNAFPRIPRLRFDVRRLSSHVSPRRGFS